MTQDEIIRMAREAGFAYELFDTVQEGNGLERFAALVAEATKAQPQCNQHPDAPHGFDRNASHSADRYVCECESWEQPQNDWVDLTDDEILNGLLKWRRGEYELQIAYAAIHMFKEKNTPPSVEVMRIETLEKAAKAFEGEEHGQISAAIRSMK